MNSIHLILFSFVFLALGYVIYGGFLTRVFGVKSGRKTPAHSHRDGVDFEPAKHWGILFGHHFSAIAGAGPVIGPVLACAYWGWGPALIWLLLGAVFLGGVSDFASLFVSIRSKGRSIASVAQTEVSSRAKFFFLIFIWFSLILVIAVFAIFTAKTFVEEPSIVLPSLGLVPIAIIFGWLVYWKNVKNALATSIGLILLALLLFGGNILPIQLPSSLPVEGIWIVVLLIYCYFASITPVQILLQPRDYLASFILFAAIGLGVVSVLMVHPTMEAAPFLSKTSAMFPEAGPLWPMLFVMIACGAISGFHALVSSGTTAKQIASEVHTCRIAYGAMLVESFMGVLVLVCVAGCLSYTELGTFLKRGGPIEAFSEGYGKLSKMFLGGYGKPFAILALNAFVLTTLDAATRIGRYLTEELFGIKNKHISTLLVVVASAALALTGHWARLWPVFGTANQLIAGIALLVASLWLLNRKRPMWFTLIPSFLMLGITVVAFLYQIQSALTRSKPDYLIAGLSIVLIVVALSVFFDAALRFFGKRRWASSRKSPFPSELT